MISDKLKKAIDEQIKFELDSAYIYLAMSNYMADQAWDGAANWLKHQAEEEIEHATAMIEYVISRGARPTLKAIDVPGEEFGTYLDVFKTAYEHECKVSKAIDKLVAIAIEEKDYATENFLRKFVDEQVEEEETSSGIVDRVELTNNAPAGLLVIDKELGARD